MTDTKAVQVGNVLEQLKKEPVHLIFIKIKIVELVGYTTCGGCPGGNIEYAPEELKKNGAEVIHFATGMVVGYPPCPYIKHFKDFIEIKVWIKSGCWYTSDSGKIFNNAYGIKYMEYT